MLKRNEIDQLIALRHTLHQMPELSGQEKSTAQKITDFLNTLKPDTLETEIGGYGILATWRSEKQGPHILLRAELDALPIHELNALNYSSKIKGVSHKCGHDGHMAILCGVVILLNRLSLEAGSVSLLFQPAEETGKGAQAVLNDPKSKSNDFDYTFALHNIPGLKIGEITSKEGTFCMASKGLKISLKGRTAHASQPSTGASPTECIFQLTQFINHELLSLDFTADTLATITHINIGERTFGISPGKGELWLTIRSIQNHDLDFLEESISHKVRSLAKKYSLKIEIEVEEPFRATINSKEGFDVLKDAHETTHPMNAMKKPNPWLEDFGLFLEQIPGAMFGLGAGEECFDLHDPNYDFPDSLIEIGTQAFWKCIKECIKKAT